MKSRAWAAFWMVGFIWGSSFLFIRIGITGEGLFAVSDGGGFKTAEIVFVRTAIAAVGLSAVLYLRKLAIPKDWKTRRALAIIGVGNIAAPFMLITWSEQFITSGLAAVLQSTTALMALVVAHFLFADDRITPAKVVGLAVGFVGIVILFSSEIGGENGIAGMIGMVLASACYATFTSYGRKLIQGNVQPIIVSWATLTVGAIVTAPLAFFGAGGFTPLAQVSTDALVGVVVLGLFNTFLAYLFYYFIVSELGVARAAMVTYITPPVGVVLGVLILNEPLGLPLLLGGGLIVTGIAIVNLRRRQRLTPPASPASEGVK